MAPARGRWWWFRRARRAKVTRSRHLRPSPVTCPTSEFRRPFRAIPVVAPGDRVIVDGAIRPRPDSPYGAYLERLGAVGTLTARTLEATRRRPTTQGAAWRTCGVAAAEALARVLPEPEAGLAAGILIGLRDRVDRDLAAAFTTAGVSHVVAISGWNIAIVAAAVAAMAGRLGRRRRSVVTIVAIVAYVAFAGGSPSVVRAATHGRGRVGRSRKWPRGTGDSGARLGRHPPPGLRSWADRRCRVPAVIAGDRRPDRLGDAADRVDRPARAGPTARLARREPWRVVGSAGRDTADHPRFVRSAGDPVAAGQPGRRPARGARHGRRHHRPHRRSAGGRWCAGRRGGRAGGAGMGDPADPRDVRRGRRRAALREHLARPAARRGRRRRGCRRSGRGDLVAAETTRGAGHPSRADILGPWIAARRARCARSGPRRRPRRPGRADRLRDGRRRRRGDAIARLRPGLRARRRARRCDPRRGVAWGAIADRRRTGSRSPPGRARSADPAVGSADRRGGPESSARGSRRRVRAAPRAIPRRPRLRARHARPRSRLRGMDPASDRTGLPDPSRARGGRSPEGRRDRPARPLADRRTCAVRATRRRNGDQQRFRGRPRRGGRPPVPAHGRRRGGDRSDPAGRGAADRRSAQGRPPWQPDGHDRAIHRGGPTPGRGGVGGRRQPVRASDQGDAGSTGRRRRSGPADGPGRDRRRGFRRGRDDRPDRGWSRGRDRRGCTERGRSGPGNGVPMRYPGDRARPEAGTSPTGNIRGSVPTPRRGGGAGTGPRSRPRPTGRLPSVR